MGTGKKVLDSVMDSRAERAVRRKGSINFVEVILEFRAPFGAELGKDCSIVPMEGELRGINFRRGVSKNGIRSRRLYSFLDSRGVELGDGSLIIWRGKNTICQERLYCREKFRLEGGLFVTRTRGSSYIGMGGMGRA